MKKSALKLFLLMEGLLGLAVLFQLVQDTDLLLVFLFGLIFIKFGAAKSERRQILGLVGSKTYTNKTSIKKEKITMRRMNLLFTAIIAYSAKTAHPFQRNGALFRLKLSGAQLID